MCQIKAQVKRESSLPSYHLRTKRATGRGLEAGDEVAIVTSLGRGAGLLGQEGGGLRGSGPRPAAIVKSHLSSVKVPHS
jgi:hypothetical protein